MPTSLYGPGDNFDLETSHVLPALIRKFHEAKVNNQPQVVLWGTGTPRREFLYVDDLADALLFLMQKYDAKDIGEFVNIGTGKDITIRDLAVLIKEVLEYNGEIVWDEAKPDGTPRKLLSVDKINKIGWRHTTNLKSGIKMTYRFYKQGK